MHFESNVLVRGMMLLAVSRLSVQLTSLLSNRYWGMVLFQKATLSEFLIFRKKNFEGLKGLKKLCFF